MEGTLYVIGTPIGNLQDISLRAVEILGSVEAIFAEDTRVSGKLLSHLGISVPVFRLDAHTEHTDVVNGYIDMLCDGKSCALLSDAGTPGISDPGSFFIRRIQEEQPEINIVPIPGPSALTAALSVSGVAPGPILFLGFPPHKKGRQTFFSDLQSSRDIVVLYESVHRFMKTLDALVEYVPDRRIGVFRELTKMHEEIKHGTAAEVRTYFIDNADHIRGEFVIIIEGASV